MPQRFAAAFQAFFQLASACRLSTATVRWSYLPKLTCEEAQAEMDEALKARLGLRLQDTCKYDERTVVEQETSFEIVCCEGFKLQLSDTFRQ